MTGPTMTGPIMTGAEPHLLVVDDDARIRELLRQYLTGAGFRVSTAGDAAEARARLANLEFDLVVLDVMMPGESGLEFTRDLKSKNERTVPILLLTAMDAPSDRVNGLEHGADDYLAKPFEPRELVLRIRNILQRIPAPAPSRECRFGPFRFDFARGELFRGDEPVHLTTVEARLLLALVQSPGEVMSREALAEAAEFSGNERTVDVQMTRLRRKIEPDAKFPRYLQTVRGTGYVFKPD